MKKIIRAVFTHFLFSKIHTEQFSKTTFLDSRASKHVIQIKTQHENVWPNTILPLSMAICKINK